MITFLSGNSMFSVDKDCKACIFLFIFPFMDNLRYRIWYEWRLHSIQLGSMTVTSYVYIYTLL